MTVKQLRACLAEFPATAQVLVRDMTGGGLTGGAHQAILGARLADGLVASVHESDLQRADRRLRGEDKPQAVELLTDDLDEESPWTG